MTKLKVLVVDDSKTTVQVLRVYLMGPEYEVRVTGRASEAIGVLASWIPDLVITDVNMPGISGIELCKQLKMLVPAPVIIVTSKLTREVREAALEAGADGMLPKPLDAEKLKYMARTLVAS